MRIDVLPKENHVLYCTYIYYLVTLAKGGHRDIEEDLINPGKTISDRRILCYFFGS